MASSSFIGIVMATYLVMGGRRDFKNHSIRNLIIDINFAQATSSMPIMDVI
jgi:hypothetical protein